MATAQDLTVEEKLAALKNLQYIDSKIDSLRVLRGELPMEVKDLEDEIEGLSSRINTLQEEHDGMKRSVTENELKIKESEANIQKYEKQQNNVRNNREFDAITKEIEMANLDIQLSQKKIKDASEEMGPKEEYLNESKELLNSRKEDLEIKKKELEVISKETEKEEEQLIADSVKAGKKIEDRLLSAYGRLRKTYKNKLAVVQVERDACGGCFAKVPPQRQLEISQRKKILVCEHCGRILVDKEVEE